MSIKIVNNLISYFLLVSLLPLTVAGFLAYRINTESRKEGILERLDALIDGRVDRIERLVEERKRDAIFMACRPSVIEVMEKVIPIIPVSGINSPDFKLLENKFKDNIQSFSSYPGLHDVLMVTQGGEVVFSLLKGDEMGTNLNTGSYRDTALAQTFKLVMGGKEAVISDIDEYGPSKESVLFVAAPIRDRDKLLGAFIFCLDATEINEFVHDYEGLMNSGETVLISVRDNETIWIAPTRHDPNAAFKRKLDKKSKSAIPAQEASQGKNGSGVYPDYRGVEVLAVWRYLPSLKLGMIIKIDESEAMAPVRKLGMWFIYLGLGTFAAVFAMSLFVSQAISRPIVALTRATGRMAGGDLQTPVDTGGRDELGILSRSVDGMQISLRKARDENTRSVMQLKLQDWLKGGLNELNTSVRGDKSMEKMTNDALMFLSKYLKAGVSVLYIFDEKEDCLRIVANYAFTRNKRFNERIRLGEGLAGQAARERKIICLDNIPPDYLAIASATGAAVPCAVLAVPLVIENQLFGVMEFGSFKDFSALEVDFLKQAGEALAISISANLSRERIAKLLEESQSQSEELQSQSEELRSANEELEEQTQRLQQSEEKLKAQQEELQVTNEELEEKNEVLDRQKREVEKARAEVVQRAEDLALASKYKSEFLANMSHELRTPLNSLLLLSRGLTDNKKGNLTGDQVESARIIYQSGSDLLTLINEILDLSKIEAGRMDLRVTEVSLSDIADSVRATFQHFADDKGLSFGVRVLEGAPEKIKTDRQRLEQVIRNLLSNAIKFTEKGEVKISFGMAASDTVLRHRGLLPESTLAITVEDTGIGIANDHHKIIFEAFQQADGGISRKFGGTGLGLSISRELARLLGGEIQVLSEPDKGSIFTMFIPVGGPAPEFMVKLEPDNDFSKTPMTQEAVKSSVSKPVTDDRNSIQKGDRVILIVDDDARFEGILMKYCRDSGLKCLSCTSGEEAIEIARRFRPGGIILDLKLPGIDGWSVLDTLKQDPSTRHIPIHIMSVDKPVADALRKGAIGYLQKPVNHEDIEGALRKLAEVAANKVKKVLVVDDDKEIRRSIVKLISDEQVLVEEATSAKEALAALKGGHYDCMILDLGLMDLDGRQLLKTLESDSSVILPPVIVYTARELTSEETMELRNYSDSIIIKDVRSEDRLFDEVSLFLHRVVSEMPEQKRKIITRLHEPDSSLHGKKVMVVDDDMRTLFALSKLLSDCEMKVLKAENGEKALKLLEEHPDVNLVLMDIMMPVMDGLEAIRRIRAQGRFVKLPIIALTAKAMKGDREQCMSTGASDYLPKPLDQDRLLSMMRVWLYGKGGAS